MLRYISHPECRLHDAGPMHPETAERLDAINDQLIMSGLDFVLLHSDAPYVTREQLLRVHDADYLDRIFATSPAEGYVTIDGDTVMSPGTLAAARRAAGAGVLGVDMIMAGEAGPVFCGVRPPGHHAERDKAMGFCLFNNIAVAAAHALAAHGLGRVAIVDFDVHHGNGTEGIFAADGRVMVSSIFQHPFYPFSGDSPEADHIVPLPLPAGTGSADFRKAVEDICLPALDAFAPDFLFISAGFDGHVLDDMSALALTEADYGWITQRLVEIADRHAAGRILSMLEGGYDPGALARSVVAHLKALMGP
ncbi:histone deacetylase family protein [Oceanibium sediminis]|uniref:histone deacetylase family protein n=1 Tax=Oceanibium sediminis TaxID=2026339 RepID=UPI000DD37DA0|nr:histone deacetylase family protein [Oceanibium sediminis]